VSGPLGSLQPALYSHNYFYSRKSYEFSIMTITIHDYQEATVHVIMKSLIENCVNINIRVGTSYLLLEREDETVLGKHCGEE